MKYIEYPKNNGEYSKRPAAYFVSPWGDISKRNAEWVKFMAQKPTFVEAKAWILANRDYDAEIRSTAFSLKEAKVIAERNRKEFYGR